jgi:hypothetical protein
MPLSFLVFDDFYADPMEVRRAALRLEYPQPKARPNYPGRNSAQRLMIAGIEEMVSKMVNEPLVAAKNQAHGYCRISFAADDAERRYTVHIDPGAWWSGIVYLTLPEHCEGGTEFFRHKESGSDRAPLYPHELAAAKARNFGDAGHAIIERDSNDMAKWDHLMTVPMRFNRLVLLRPWLWHTAGKSFGDSLENCRLVQLFFFAPAAAFSA